MKRTKIAALFGIVSSLSVPLNGCAAHLAPPSPPSSGSTLAAVAPASFAQSDASVAGLALVPDGAARTGGAFNLWGLPRAWPMPPALPFPWPWALPSRPVPAPAAGAPAAIAFAKSRLGLPYCWGGTGPNCYDCSGLTSTSWRAGGKAIPRTSEAQSEKLPEVPFDRIQPGDILWRPGHVALYVGDGQVIHAPRTGDVVRYAAATRFVKAMRP